MRRLSAIIILWCVACSLKAQTYGNEWIRHQQQYFKFPVHKEGIYRIDSAVLSTYFNLSSVNPKNFQLFIKGREQFLFVNGEGDNQVNTGDYLEFYANPRMGDVDSMAYTGISYVPNPYAGIFNDTLYGFLTLNTSVSNKRYVPETDTASALYPAADHVYHEKIFSYAPHYNYVQEYDFDVSDPHYTQAEGRGFSFNKGGVIASTFSNLNNYTLSALPFYVDVNFSGMSLSNATSGVDHQITITYNDQNNSAVTLLDTLFRGFAPARKKFVLNTQNAGNSTNVTLTSVAAPFFSAFSNTSFLHYIRIFYPHKLDFNNAGYYKFEVENSSSAPKTFFNFGVFNYSPGSSAVLLDITNGKRIRTVIAAAKVRAVIPNGSGNKVCVMAGESQIISIGSLKPVNQTGYFTNYKTAGSHPYLLVYHNSLQAGAAAYKNYRQSAGGGNYTVIAADVAALYEQFCYGINKHPLAIRNFIKFMKDSLPAAPEYVLLIGKGIEQVVLNGSTQAQNLVPTFGSPSSDNLLTAALSPSSTALFSPEIPIGRIAATSNAEVNDYLAKVQQHESTGAEDWKKRVLHFIGGDTPGLTATLDAYMESYRVLIQDTLFGAEVYTFRKNTTAPIQTSISDSIKNLISSGAALINFFGHGSQDGFDQAIDDPLTYNNTGRYPLVVANSCYSGNIHIPGLKSVSERFLFAQQKGSLGFLATTSYGFVHALNNYTSRLYLALGGSRYNMGIGDVIREASFQNSLSNDPLVKITSLDMTLHGDPAIKIANGALPDYQLKNSDVSFNLKRHIDSIGVRINIKNSGKAVRDSFVVRVERFFPNGDSVTVLKTIKAPYFKDSLVFFMALDVNRGIGLNQFKVKLDEFNEMTESSKGNNSTIGTVDVFIPGGDIAPVYPYKYAVVPMSPRITLKASTTDPFAPSATYRFQLDTCDKFTNPLQSALITSSGGVLEWAVNLPYADSTVYFWRVSRDSTSPLLPFLWKESSFQTIGSRIGWSQAHFNQFKGNTYRFVNYKDKLRQFAFENTRHSISCRNGIRPYAFDFTGITAAFNNIIISTWGCDPDGWNFIVFDSISGQPQSIVSPNWPNMGVGPYNNCICTSAPHYAYSFGNGAYCPGTSNWQTDMENFLNSVSPNNYVLAFTVGALSPSYAQVSSYSNSLYSAFESIGAVSIRTTQDTVPYILFGRKGMSAGQGKEIKGLNSYSVIHLKDSIQTRWNSGHIVSELIGPAYQWNSLHWRVKSLDNIAGDTTLLKLVGVKANGQEDTLQTFTKDSADVMALGNYVNAAVYPYLKLVAAMKDNINRTAPQLRRWQVLYEQAPECAINPLKGFASINDTLQEGDEVTFRFPIENVGTEPFKDSLVVTYWIEDNNHNKTYLQQKMKAKPFSGGQVLIDTIKINSYQLPGNNALWIHVNPLQNARYQREQMQFNNIGRYTFKVNKDLYNPLLDVTFDGIRILNGDIVSAKPSILITLRDENKFLALNDTSAFSVFLQPPNGPQQRIYFARDLQFTPARLPKNSCSILYQPYLPADGRYLLSVQARDRSKNASGSQDYRIQFEINNKPTVTNVLNYPNPFSTSTRFVFTLTGSEIPEVFTVQIMTITGKIVREITRSELGRLHIGRNITDYAWDGKDDFGDRLGNGVYLYRVITRLNGNSIEKSGTGADKFFVKDFGKMVLMR